MIRLLAVAVAGVLGAVAWVAHGGAAYDPAAQRRGAELLMDLERQDVALDAEVQALWNRQRASYDGLVDHVRLLRDDARMLFELARAPWLPSSARDELARRSKELGDAIETKIAQLDMFRNELALYRNSQDYLKAPRELTDRMLAHARVPQIHDELVSTIGKNLEHLRADIAEQLVADRLGQVGRLYQRASETAAQGAMQKRVLVCSCGSLAVAALAFVVAWRRRTPR